MRTTHIIPKFKDVNEGNIMRITGLLSIFFLFIPALIIYFVFQEGFSKESKEIVVELVNFNIVAFIAFFICGIVPIIGWLASLVICPVVLIINIIIAIQIVNGTEVKIPIILQLLKTEN